MTRQERLDLVKELMRTRPGPNREFVTPQSYNAFLEDTSVQEKKIETSAGITSIWLVEKKRRVKPSAVFVNIHGGGFVAPHMERDIVFSRRIAAQLGILVVDISYRTAVDTEFPVACYESYDCVKWVHDNAEGLGVDEDKIMVGGHSAGGNLTAGICLQSEEKQEFKVALQVLDYPPLDLFTDPAAKPECDATRIPPDRARNFNLLYVGEPEKARNPLASPLYATPRMLSRMPEAVIITAGKDNLRFEAEQFAVKLMEAGVPVHVKRCLHSEHGFIISCTDEYNEAIDFMEKIMHNVIMRGSTDSLKNG